MIKKSITRDMAEHVLSPLFLKDCGIGEWGVSAESRPVSWEHYESWVHQKQHIPLTYLADERKEKRADLKTILPAFQSAWVFLFPYQLGVGKGDNGLHMASYVFAFGGEDYHHAIKKRLQSVVDHMQEQWGTFAYHICVDTYPVLERDLAYRAGLGWFGKNSMLLNRKWGSAFLIGQILTELPLGEDLKRSKWETDHCGQCRACVDLCPTQAIDANNRSVSALQCLSTFTIEQRKLDDIPPSGFHSGRPEIFGCDVCLDICPWNKRKNLIEMMRHFCSGETTISHRIQTFFLTLSPIMIRQRLEKIGPGEWKRLFAGTALMRSGKRGVLKNFLARERSQPLD